MQQVVLNLILNAVEAMGSVQEGPRELSISTEQNQANGVLVAVRDTGPGIDAETSRARFRAFLHHEIQRGRDGAVDLPVDHRCPWGAVVDRCERTSRRRISVHFARRGERTHEFSELGRPEELPEDTAFQFIPTRFVQLDQFWLKNGIQLLSRGTGSARRARSAPRFVIRPSSR